MKHFSIQNNLEQIVTNENKTKPPSSFILQRFVNCLMMVFSLIGFTIKISAQSFTSGNITVFVASASASNTTGSIVELNTTTAAQAAVTTHNIDGTTSPNALRFSGSATSTCYLANSNDGTLLSFTGGNTTTAGAININTILPRGVGTFNSSGSFNLATTYTGASGNQTRSATSLNNTTWFIGDQGGIYTNGTSSASPSGNFRGVKSFGGIVYAGQSSSTATTIQVVTVSAPSGGTIAGLPGLTNNAGIQDFYLISSGSNGTNYDVLYVVSATSNTAGTIAKYSLVSGSWVSNNSYTTTFGGFGLAAKNSGTGADLFVSTGLGALTANSVIKLNDAAGYNAAINITTANNLTLYTTVSGTIIKGVAFAPVSGGASNPSGTGSANPSTVAVGGTTLLTVTVTPGATPASTGLAVTTDLTSIGGSATQTFFDDGTNGDVTAGDKIFSYSATVSAATTAGSKNIPVTITDAQSRTGNTSISLTVQSLTFTKIHDIQGSGSTFDPSFAGTQTIEGIVTRAFIGSTKLNGFYVQEEDADADADPLTSEGIFVFDPKGFFAGSNGDKVQVTGTVSEFTTTSNGNNSSLTELTASSVANISSANPLPVVTNIFLPVNNVSDLERYEGMLVNFSATTGNLTVSEYFQLGRFGQVVLAATGASNQTGTDARLDQYTQFNAPGVSGNTAYLAELAKRKIYLDDGSGVQNPDPILFGRGGNPLSASNTLRGGDDVANIIGILDERFEGYRIQTITPVNFNATNTRPVAPPAVGGTLRAASFNVLNYFNDLDLGSNITTNGLTFRPRGAETTAEFTRQRDKIFQAIINSGADVLGLMEVENNGYGAGGAIQDLVNGLNNISGAGTYAFITPAVRLGTDAINVGIIYKPASVTPSGAAATIPDAYGTGAFDVVGRKPLAQTFQQNSNGEIFTIVASHFKSKGSSSGGTGDSDAGDGQGLSNGTRTRQAQDLSAWLATNPTGTTDPDYLLVGDFNAYAKEDPITTLAAAGYNNLLPITSYSYVFDAQVGALDHALGSANLATQVAGAEKWHINADEPGVLDYNTNFKTAGQVSSLYNADAFRASDHDPVLVGLNLSPAPTVTLTVNTNTASESAATVVTVTATASSAVSSNQTVSLGVSGTGITAGDYNLSNTTITIPDGSTTGSVTFTVVDDNLFEGTETAALTISSPSSGITLGATTTQAITITDNDVPPIRITEYMHGGANGEFVEFTNIGNVAVDMTGWSFDDNSRAPGSQSLSAFGTVQPGESVILTENNAGTFRSVWNLCNGIKIIGGLTNNLGRDDEINLYDASDLLVDRLTYGDDIFAPGTIRANGKSGFVNAAGLGTNTIAQWTLSSVADAEASYASAGGDIGSPGMSTRATVSYNPCTVVTGAPTIVIDVATTTNYLDGGATTSPLSPYGVSGVISDPTDPAQFLGIDFTIGDDLTAVGSLTVTVTSSNTTVAPNGNIILTGSGASRNLKITPAAVGYSNITVSVSDGTYTTSYVIGYAASAASATPASTVWHTGISDASDAIALDDDYYVTGDDEQNVLNVYSRSASGLPFVSYNYTSHLALPDPIKPEVDVEAATKSAANANRMFWLGSMSNGKDPFDNKPNRDRLFATDVSGTGAATTFSFAGYYGNLRASLITWGDANGYNFTASAAAGVDSKATNGFAAEGMVFGPDNTSLYIGLRAPLVPTAARTKAVIAPILNFETWFNNGGPSGDPTFGSPIELDLGLRGIRDLIRLSTGTYIILAGDPGDAMTSALFRWTGNAADAPSLVNSSGNGVLNMEGAMQINEGGQLSLSKLQVISDEGTTVFYNDGSAAKDLGDNNIKKFRSDVLTGLTLCQNTITVTQGANGTIAPGTTTVDCHGSQSFTITPASCYHITDVLVDGSSVGAVSSYAFSDVIADHIITASFAINAYTITVIQDANGTIAPSTTTVDCHGNQSFSITPASCYHITDVLVDGLSVGAVSSYAFSDVTADHTITASFAINAYTITVTQGANGTIAPGTTSVDCHGGQSFTITPASCYKITDVLVDGLSVGAVSSYAFSDVIADHTITASFAINAYTITVTQGANGTIAPGTTSVDCHSSQSFSITPASCYHITDVLVDGTSVGAVSSYAFSDITAGHTITASFAINTYIITVTQGANGTIAPGTTTVNCHGGQSFLVTPTSCYHITKVLIDGTSVGAVSSYAFSDVTQNHTISATFAANTLAVNCPSGSPFNRNANGSCQYMVSGSEFDASACGAVTLTYTLSGATSGKSNTSLSGKPFNKGVTTVTWTAEDASKHKVSCSFTVTVSDKLPPVITCKPDTTIHISQNTKVYKVSGNVLNATATDNCGITSLIYSLSGATVAPYSNSNTTLANKKLNKGITVVTWKATDATGNIKTCATSVTVTNGASASQIITSSVDPKVAMFAENSFSVKVSPNPSATNFKLQVESNSNEPINIRVVDVSGRVLKVITKTYKYQVITLGDGYTAGSYFAEVTQGKDHTVVKLIKVN
ncbi:MAG: ExeM/NucH family extracellular endonuclease [Ginsengibacter sp.]